MANEESYEKTSLALGECDGALAEIPYHFLARHGIIAGSTGTGKSRAMQVMAEQLAADDVHVFVSDVKGDASGFCVPAFAQSDEPSTEEKKWNERNKLAPFEPAAFGTNYWSVSDRFIPFRFSLSSIGSILFSRVLTLNPTQESILALAFSYAKNKGTSLDTPEQLLDVLDEMVKTSQRGISPSSVNVIQRKILALEESGLSKMFGTPGVRLEDLGGLNVLNLSDARNDMSVTMAPAFLLQKLFSMLPEAGDLPKPKFIIFFDEAHYLFKDANKSLRDRMVTMLKQIRSKGVAVFFVTQDVGDIPDEILSQLSTKIIFSQKIFTEKGTARLRALSKSFPKTSFDVMEKLKTMPPGVALLSTLDESGNQTEPKEVKIFAPATTMEVVEDETLRKETDQALIRKYSRSEKKPQPKKTAEVRIGPNVLVGSNVLVQSEKPEIKKTRVKEVIVEKKVVKKTGPGFLDNLLGGLLKIIGFLIKAVGMVVTAVLIKPLKSFFKYLTKKPVRILYFLILLTMLYVLIVNWAMIQRFLKF